MLIIAYHIVMNYSFMSINQIVTVAQEISKETVISFWSTEGNLVWVETYHSCWVGQLPR